MVKTFNFSAGPAMLPRQVMSKWQTLAQASPFPNSHIGFMEIGHRTKAFQEVVQTFIANLRSLLVIPEHYHVLLMPGGGRMQFATVAMNLMGRGDAGADYFETGLWSQQAIAEARRFGNVHTVVSAIENDYRCIPDKALWRLRQEASYCHYVSNETAHGLFFGDVPETHGVPLVVDMTSDLLARPINIADYGLVYAASQKNLGAAGFTVVIVRDDLLGDAPNSIPSQLDYRSYLDDPTPVTPVTFAIYLASLVTAWIGEEGGLEVMEKRNASKAKKLYDFLDESSHFDAPVLEKYRSHTNVIFQLNAPNKTPELIAFAEQSGLYGLGGHRAVGGLRASLYNAMEEEGVDALIDCLKRFVLNA